MTVFEKFCEEENIQAGTVEYEAAKKAWNRNISNKLEDIPVSENTQKQRIDLQKTKVNDNKIDFENDDVDLSGLDTPPCTGPHVTEEDKARAKPYKLDLLSPNPEDPVYLQRMGLI